MKVKKQVYRGRYNADGSEKDALSNSESGEKGGNFWSNFESITGSLGSLWTNVAGGWAAITSAQNTQTINKNNSGSTALYFGIGVVVLVVILVLVVVLVRKPA
jgi:hypothetical protein